MYYCIFSLVLLDLRSSSGFSLFHFHLCCCFICVSISSFGDTNETAVCRHQRRSGDALGRWIYTSPTPAPSSDIGLDHLDSSVFFFLIERVSVAAWVMNMVVRSHLLHTPMSALRRGCVIQITDTNCRRRFPPLLHVTRETTVPHVDKQ